MEEVCIPVCSFFFCFFLVMFCFILLFILFVAYS
jgi:hypothetical protein